MASSNQDILDALESIARESPVMLLQQDGMQECAVVSLAISLKRIADSLDELKSGEFPSLHGSITNLAWEAGRSFQGGMRTDR